MKRIRKMLSWALSICIIISCFQSINVFAVTPENLNLSEFPLSSSTQTTTGTIAENTKILHVASAIDFEVGQGIAIENLERISDAADGSRKYTWFAAQITAIDTANNQITINRTALFSVADVTVKHDNYYVFRDISDYCSTGNKHIVIPRGEYEINAVWIARDESNWTSIASESLQSNATTWYERGLDSQQVFLLSNVDNVTLDFSNSKIKLNGNMHRGRDLLKLNTSDTVYGSKTQPVEFILAIQSNNIAIMNLEIDGGGMQATKAEGVHTGRNYAIEFCGVTDGKIINVKASHFMTDAVLLAKSQGGHIPCSNIYIDNLVADRNARQGMTVTSAKGLTVINSKFTNTGYLDGYGYDSPGSGIDFELEVLDANDAESLLKNNYMCDIYLDNIVFYNNINRSFHFYQRSYTYNTTGDETKTPKMDNIVFNNILSYQPNGKGHMLIADSSIDLVDITIKNSNFVNKLPAAQSSADYELLKNVPQLEVRYENCNFMGSVAINNILGSDIQYTDCNFLMDRCSYFALENTNAIAANNCLFYFTSKAIEERSDWVFSRGWRFNDCAIYNGHTDSILITTASNSGQAQTVFKDTKLVGDSIGLNFKQGTSSSYYQNEKINTRIVSSIETELVDTVAVSPNEVSLVEEKYKEIKNEIIKKINANNLEPYDVNVIPPTTYSLTISSGTGGEITTGASGLYAKDAQIPINAVPEANYSFSKWTSSNGGKFANEYNANTIFTMPANDTTITATFTYTSSNGSNQGGNNPGGGSSSGSGSGSGSSSGSSSGGGSGTGGSTGASGSGQSGGGTTYTASDWGTARNRARSAKGGDTVIVNLQKDTLLPADILLLIKGKDINLIMDLNSYKWTINGLSVGDVSSGQNFDMKVSTVYGKPFSNIAENTDVATFDLAHNGEFPFVPVLDWQLDKDHISKKVYLYYCNEGTGKLEYVSASTVDLNAKVRLAFSHASKYVLTAKILSESYVQENRDIGANTSSISTVPYFVDNGKHAVVPISSIVDDLVTYIAPKTAVYSYKDNSKSFSDVSGHWAADNISFVTSRDLFSGSGNNKFAPDGVMTRGMLVTVLGKLHGVDASKYRGRSAFSDVDSSAWYAPYVAWAAESGIISGTGNGKFSPDSALTREQLAVVITNYAKFAGHSLNTTKNETYFSDVYKISAWARDSVKTVQLAGIMSGKANNTFDPQGFSTRAEVSTVLRNYIESMLTKK